MQVCREQLDLLDRLERQDRQGRLDQKDNKEAPVVLDYRVLLVTLDLKELLEIQAPLDSLVHLVYKVPRALAVNLDYLV
jgi:hypothetical protein